MQFLSLPGCSSGLKTLQDFTSSRTILASFLILSNSSQEESMFTQTVEKLGFSVTALAKGGGLFLASLFYSIDLYVCFYVNVMLFLLM